MQLFSAEQSKTLDVAAQQYLNISGYQLMCRAGQAAFEMLLEAWPTAKHIVCLCGGGNNGGDAWVVARLARHAGMSVVCVTDRAPQQLADEAAEAFAEANGIQIVDACAEVFAEADVIVDGLLGAGFSGALRSSALTLIEMVNASGSPVLSLDVPSGVCVDSNQDVSYAIQADITLAFIAWKIVHFTGPGRAYCGRVRLACLGVDDRCRLQQASVAQLLDIDELVELLPPRHSNAHKGDFGHVLTVGGDHGFGGAIILASLAAQRVGAGLVSMASRSEHVAPLLSLAPQVMVRAIEVAAHIDGLLDANKVVVVGPGLGQSAWGQQLLQRVLLKAQRAVVDADALNILVGRVEKLKQLKQCVISPHPGEAARLLGCTVDEVERDRMSTARRLHELSGACVVLKGQGSIICDASGVAVCPYGNPGMASAGMGDVLSGIIAGLMAQGLSAGSAARLGVALHSYAADREARLHGERGLAAIDLIPIVRELLNA